jgi:hypothetical protein
MSRTRQRSGTGVASQLVAVALLPPRIMTKERVFTFNPPPAESIEDQPIVRNHVGPKSALNRRVEYIDLVEHVTLGVLIVHASTEGNDSRSSRPR